MKLFNQNEMTLPNCYSCRKIGNKVTTISSSENLLKKSSLTVFSGSRDFKLFPSGTWNQSSDRINKHSNLLIVPRGGNSTKKTLLGIKPGSQSPGGLGVDIKHNSYSRYLNRKKGFAINKKCNCV